jgi:arginine exporter protein ArgO
MSTNTNRGAETSRRSRTTMQTVALVMGVVFLLVGILGFVPGITSQYDTMSMAGHESMGLLLGIFQVSYLHNVVHVLFGVVGLLAARSYAGARAYLLYGGVIYLVLWIYGLIANGATSANFVPVNTADNWLHLVLAIVMIGAAFLLGRRSAANGAQTAR